MKLPRFPLRELFLLVVIAAMGCGWWGDQGRIAKRLNEVDQLKADFQAEQAVTREEMAASRELLDRLHAEHRDSVKRWVKRVGSGLTIESEYHQKLIEGMPIQ